jgi:hypothetical protein
VPYGVLIRAALSTFGPLRGAPVGRKPRIVGMTVKGEIHQR